MHKITHAQKWDMCMSSSEGVDKNPNEKEGGVVV